jgi:hypothetical protein
MAEQTVWVRFDERRLDEQLLSERLERIGYSPARTHQ